MNEQQPVWITGVGTANPLGTSFAETADNLLRGKSGIVKVTDFSLPAHLCQIAGRLPLLPRPEEVHEDRFAGLLPQEKLFLWCCSEALRAANLSDRKQEVRIGLVLGLGGEWMHCWEVNHHQGQPSTPKTESVIDLVQRHLRLTGPGATVAAACASANYALAQARQWIRMGWVEVCLAGGGDMFVMPVAMSCFANLRAMSRRNDTPAEASRPVDQDRDGFVMGEGGVVFVLESARHARQRGAEPLAELAGFGSSSDAFHMVIPNPDPQPAVRAMRRALSEAKVAPADIDYLNAHATSTPVGDPAESRILREVLGEAVRRVPVSSTKSMTGHLLSGAAAMNVLACLAAFHHQALPPTINLYKPDPECDLCHVPREARPHPVNVAVSNSLGFGGSNTTVVLRKVA
jgi:3-oxoacyl-[acyl-carrier-protein] synthase II